MMHDDGRGRLLGVELELLRQLDPDPLGAQQLEQLGLLLQVGQAG
jgi:hypothetical protein